MADWTCIVTEVLCSDKTATTLNRRWHCQRRAAGDEAVRLGTLVPETSRVMIQVMARLSHMVYNLAIPFEQP